MRILKTDVLRFFNSPGYDLIKQLSEELQRRWKDAPIKSDTEFETLWKAVEKEVKPMAIKELFDELTNIAESE